MHLHDSRVMPQPGEEKAGEKEHVPTPADKLEALRAETASILEAIERGSLQSDDGDDQSPGEDPEKSAPLSKHSTRSVPTTAQDWDGPDDPENPQNWSNFKRAFHIVPTAALGFAV